MVMRTEQEWWEGGEPLVVECRRCQTRVEFPRWLKMAVPWETLVEMVTSEMKGHRHAKEG
jgi:hypothetical protein